MNLLEFIQCFLSIVNPHFGTDITHDVYQAALKMRFRIGLADSLFHANYSVRQEELYLFKAATLEAFEHFAPNLNIFSRRNTAAASELKPKKDQNDQVAIINFIDLDNNGKQLTSSGPLTGKPGESINDLYSTEIPLKAIAQTGYHVVFNGFDGDGQIQKFNNNDLMTQVFTVGLSKSAKSETKAKAPEKQSDVDLDAVREVNNKDTAAMALGIAATIISLIGLIGKENK